MKTAVTPKLAPAPYKGKLEWPMLLQWLREDGWVGVEDAERVTARFRAGPSSLHPLVRLGGAGMTRRAGAGSSGTPLDTELLTEWLAGRCGLPYLRIDPLKVDVGRVADVMSVQYAQSRLALPVLVGPTEVTIATAEPFDTG